MILLTSPPSAHSQHRTFSDSKRQYDSETYRNCQVDHVKNAPFGRIGLEVTTSANIWPRVALHSPLSSSSTSRRRPLNPRTCGIKKCCVYHPCLSADVLDSLRVVGTWVSVVTQIVRRGPVHRFIVRTSLLTDHNIAQYTWKSDHNGEFYTAGCWTVIAQFHHTVPVVVLDWPYLAENSGRIIVRRFSGSLFPIDYLYCTAYSWL